MLVIEVLAGEGWQRVGPHRFITRESAERFLRSRYQLEADAGRARVSCDPEEPSGKNRAGGWSFGWFSEPQGWSDNDVKTENGRWMCRVPCLACGGPRCPRCGSQYTKEESRSWDFGVQRLCDRCHYAATN